MRPIPFLLPLAVHFQRLTFGRERLPGSLLSLGIVAGAILAGLGLTYVMVNLSPALALLGLLAVPAGFLMVLYPEVGLLLVVFAIPLEDFNQIPGLGGLSVIKLLGLGALAAYAVHYIISDRQEKLVSVPQNVYIALFVLAVLISDMTAIDRSGALDKTFKLVRAVSFYFLVINVVRSRATLRRVLWVMIAAGFLAAVYGLYQYYFTPEVLGSEMRVSGPLDDPMGFSYAMLILLPLAWYMLTHQTNPAVRIFSGMAGLTFLYAIVLSGTRSAMLAAAGALVLIALRQKHRFITIILIAVLLVASLLLMPEQVKRRAGLSPETDKAAQASTERRETYLVFGVQLFLENPIVGIGLTGFTEAYSHSEYRFWRGEDDVERIAHNMYMEIATGTGLLGLVPFLLLLFVSLYNLQCVVRQSQPGELNDLAKTLQISLVAFLFIGMYSSSQYDKPLWLLIGLASVVPVLARQSDSARNRPGGELGQLQPEGANVG